MTTANKTDSFDRDSIDRMHFQALLAQIEKEKGGDPQALIVNLSKALEEVLEEVSSGKGKSEEKIVRPNFNASAQTQSSAPSNGTMQQLLGQLMGQLAQLEAEIAKFGNDKSRLNTDVSNSILTELQAKVQSADKHLKEIVADENSPWQKLKDFFIALGVIILTVVAIAAAQPEFAAAYPALSPLLVTACATGALFTTLSASGAMQKMTEWFSKELQKLGIPKDVANLLTSALIVSLTIAATALACGGTAATAVEEIAEESGEALAASPETTQTFFQKLATFVDENNPFSKLPRYVNLGIMTGSVAAGTSGFGQDIATLMLSKMSDTANKEKITAVISAIINLLTALVGAGAGMAIAGGAAITESAESVTTSNLMKWVQYAMAGAGVAQGASQTTEGAIQVNLAKDTEKLGKDQADISLLQALINMNNGQLAADGRTLKGQLQNHSQGLATLGGDLVKESAAVAHVLQA